MKPNISVILPSRGRVKSLDRMLSSLRNTAVLPPLVEVIVRCDVDDHETVEYLSADAWAEQLAPSGFIVGPRLNGYSSLATFINEAARLSTADLVMVVNDDAEFETSGWDTALRQVSLAYPDGFFDLGVDTVMNSGNFVFPCQSRRQIETLGCFYDDRLIYTDIWLRDVLQPFGRAIPVPEVRIAHRWQGQSTDQAKALTVTMTPEYIRLYALCVEEARAKIRAVLPC